MWSVVVDKQLQNRPYDCRIPGSCLWGLPMHASSVLSCDWLVRLAYFDIDVTWLVHAVGSGQDDVLIEDGSSTEPSIVLIQKQSLQRWDRGEENFNITLNWSFQMSSTCHCPLRNNNGQKHQIFSHVWMQPIRFCCSTYNGLLDNNRIPGVLYYCQ